MEDRSRRWLGHVALLEKGISGGAIRRWATRPLEREMLAVVAEPHACNARTRKREGRQIGIRQEMICVVSPRPAEQYRHDSSSVSRCHEIDSKINPRLRCVRDLQRAQR